MKNQPLFVFFGHHKCASSWIQRIVWNIATDSGYGYLAVGRLEAGQECVIREKIKERPDLGALGLPNARWEMVAQLPEFSGFHVVRDPRDMLVSAYFSHLKSHRVYAHTPQFYLDHRESLRAVGKCEGLLLELDGPIREVFEDMRNWRNGELSQILEIKMEDLTADPFTTFESILTKLGRPIGSDPFPVWWGLSRTNQVLRRWLGARGIQRSKIDPQSIEWHTGRLAFSKLTGRAPGEEDSSSHLRKGEPGDWKNHFWRELGERFQSRYGELLGKYGYAEDASWVNELPEHRETVEKSA